ncbi:MAG: PE-PPE domain-containing protein [Mycobacterium sp.]|nr:PE-PPE domain-containing protein [Mycobacterium sp.]
MGKDAGGRHRAAAPRRVRRARHGDRRRAGLPTAGIAIGGVAVLALTAGLAPVPQAAEATRAVSADARLAAGSTYYLRGTRIGNEPGETDYRLFISRVLTGTGKGTDVSTDNYTKIDYPASIWPVSTGYLSDPKWNDSVTQGVQKLTAENRGTGDVVFGFSQGAVVASKYKADHPSTAANPGPTYVLVENPSRPNGGVMARFAGLTVPIMDLTFSGATPVGDEASPSKTVDVARQYDGWADFPTYPLNLLATANAIMGIVLVHGKTQTELTGQNLVDAKGNDTDSMYYQKHGDTTYYLIRTDTLPLLMPVAAISPQLAAALDPPLRALIETGYDRTDYSKPTTAQLFPSLSALQKSLDNTATDADVTAGKASGAEKLSAQATGSVAGAIATALKPLTPQTTTTTTNRLLRKSGPAEAAAVFSTDDLTDGPADPEKPTSPAKQFTLPQLKAGQFTLPKLKPTTASSLFSAKPKPEAAAVVGETEKVTADNKVERQAPEPNQNQNSTNDNTDHRASGFGRHRRGPGDGPSGPNAGTRADHKDHTGS